MIRRGEERVLRPMRSKSFEALANLPDKVFESKSIGHRVPTYASPTWCPAGDSLQGGLHA